MLYLESELGLENQAIVKDGDKLLLMLNPEFNDIDQETLNKLRKLLVSDHAVIEMKTSRNYRKKF